MINLMNLKLDALLSENLNEKLNKVQERQQRTQVSPELQEFAQQQIQRPQVMPTAPRLQEPRQQMQQPQGMRQTPMANQAGGMFDEPLQQTMTPVLPSEFDAGFGVPEQKQMPTQPMTTPTQPEAPVQPAPAVPAGPEATMPSAPPPEVSSEGYQGENMEILRNYHETLLPEGQEFGFEDAWTGQATSYGGPGMSESQEWIDSIDYARGNQGKTIGGITGAGGDKDPWGRDVEWSEGTIYEGNKLGDVVSTPAGDYLVVNAADGQKALKPLKGAKHGGGQFFFNMTNKGHHVGINPLTGDAWYQAAPSVQEIEGADYWSSIAWSPEIREAVRSGEMAIPTEVRQAYSYRRQPEFSSFLQGLSRLGERLSEEYEMAAPTDVTGGLFSKYINV